MIDIIQIHLRALKPSGEHCEWERATTDSETPKSSIFFKCLESRCQIPITGNHFKYLWEFI